MNKEEAKIILISNLKGSAKKRVPLIKISEAVHLLLNDKEYGSFSALKNEFKISRQILQSFYKIKEQPSEIQKLINENKILLDTNEKLFSIKNIQHRIDLANTVSGLSAFDARDVIDYWKSNPNLTPIECKNLVLQSKDIKRNIHIIIIPLDESIYYDLKKKASINNMKIEDMASLVIKTWINSEEEK
jgi:hypothetical protein